MEATFSQLEIQHYQLQVSHYYMILAGHDLFAMSVCYIHHPGAPHTPNISVMSRCTEVEVQWSIYFPENDQTTTTISIKSHDIVESKRFNNSKNSLVFDQLIADSLYTITYSVFNCAGRREVTTDIWTCEDYKQFKTLVVRFLCYFLIPQSVPST